MHQTHPDRTPATRERLGEDRPEFPDPRGQVILTAIINEHFVTGEPVGSKVLADSLRTVGNELGDHSQRDGRA